MLKNIAIMHKSFERTDSRSGFGVGPVNQRAYQTMCGADNHLEPMPTAAPRQTR